jgi:muramoyltetrapeptide carboxypeptidase
MNLTLVIVAAMMNLSVAAFPDDPPPIFPAALQKGDTIAFVAPAGRLEKARIDQARARLEALGYVVRIPDDLYRERGYLAGDDKTRAAELMAAFRDPTVKAVFPGTGNYGTTRILDLLDYDVIRSNPKIFIGFSDITALHLAIQRKTGLVTFHSPNPMWGLGSEPAWEGFAADYFWRAIAAGSYGDPEGKSRSAGYTFELPEVEQSKIKTLHGGTARGRLTGGNLSLICPLLGTPYEMQTEGRILFLEDVGERPYRVDRYLSHLKLAGKLDKLAGVIIGVFNDCDPKPGEVSLSLDQVFLDYFEGLGIPVIQNFPVGHVKANATLPMGAMVELDADRRIVRVMEEPVRRGR